MPALGLLVRHLRRLGKIFSFPVSPFDYLLRFVEMEEPLLVHVSKCGSRADREAVHYSFRGLVLRYLAIRMCSFSCRVSSIQGTCHPNENKVLVSWRITG
jgi:hypothetical protein